MRIITLTVNPAIDLHIRCDEPVLGKDNLSYIEGRDTGGKGINVSRALKSYGVDSVAAMILGRENGEQFVAEMRSRKIECISVYTDGYVRENINIHSLGYDTVIATEGPFVGACEIAIIEDEIMKIAKGGDILCFSGRISTLSDKAAILDFLQRMNSYGLRLVLDSKSLSGEDIKELAPFMIKPNLEELVGRRLNGREDIVLMAEHISRLAENVLITLGKDGALLIRGESIYSALVPEVCVKSNVGAGDSSIAGFLASYISGAGAGECLRLAVSFGTAACLTQGTLPPDINDITRIYESVTAEKQA